MTVGNLSRREFVALAASTALISPTRVVAKDETPPVLPLGFSLYGMKRLPIEAALQACARIGYDAVELALLPGWPTDPETMTAEARQSLRKQLTDLKLQLPAVMENLNLLAPATDWPKVLDRLKRAAEFARELNPSAPPLLETVLGGSPANWDAVRQQMADRLLEWADIARQFGMMLAIKPHVGGALHTPEGAVWLLDRVNRSEVRLAYDFSHYQLRGYELLPTLKTLAARSIFVHVKDAKGTAGAFEFLLPGASGTVRYADYLRGLSDRGYRGCVMVEVSGMIFNREGYDPIAAAQQSYQVLSAAYQEAGVMRRRT